MNVDALEASLSHWLGLNLSGDELTFGHMAWRTAIVLVFSILLLRVGHKRFIGHSAGYDVLLMMILGSVLSRAINGDAAFFPTLGAAFVLVVLHRLISAAAFRWHWISVATKGRDNLLVSNGQMDREAMRRSHITDDDLLENIRLHGRTESLADVRAARLERSGGISVVRKDNE